VLPDQRGRAGGADGLGEDIVAGAEVHFDAGRVDIVVVDVVGQSGDAAVHGASWWCGTTELGGVVKRQ